MSSRCWLCSATTKNPFEIKLSPPTIWSNAVGNSDWGSGKDTEKRKEGKGKGKGKGGGQGLTSATNNHASPPTMKYKKGGEAKGTADKDGDEPSIAKVRL